MTEHDVLVGFRLRLFTLAEELGNVSAACRAMGVHRSTYYRLKRRVDRWGLEALSVRERRRPRMPNEIGPHLEQRIVAFALGHPGLGPRRISAELAREKWGGIRISEHGVWRVLRRVGLNTRSKRLALVARHRDPYERRPPLPEPERHIEAHEPGQKVRLDCFYVGRLSGTKGTVWQYTAIDVAAAYAWAELRTSERNPSARHTRELVHRVARELKAAGWKLREVGTDNGSEFRSKQFRDAVEQLAARQRFIKAGRPPLNPFTHGAGAFTEWLGEPRWPGGRVSRYVAAVHAGRADLRAAFPTVPGADERALIAWVASKYSGSRLPDGLPTAAAAS